MRIYSCLKKQKFKSDEFQLVPIRYDDRMDIMKWRNEQMYHLRQVSKISEIDQNKYFNDVLSKLFNQKNPNQLLFSFLQDNKCIGYGGLVHINWIDKNAELSFIMDTKLEEKYFSKNWKIFLKLIENVAFEELNFHKLFTFAFDIRPHLYRTLEESEYEYEATLKNHYFFKRKYYDIVIHSKFNPR